MNIIENIKNYFIKNAKIIFFLIIFAFVTYFYNQNYQDLNYFLKRGIVLEYSISQNQNPDKTLIKDFLSHLGLKYSSVDIADYSFIDYYDNDFKKVEKSLYIALPYKADKNKTALFNKISDFIFEQYKSSKLIDVKTLNENYDRSYGGFLKFIQVLFFSLLIWAVCLSVILTPKKAFNLAKDALFSFYKKQKENIKAYVSKTKEKGFGYFLKTIFLEDAQDDENVTKQIIYTIVFVLVCVIIIRYFIGELRWIPSGSMRNTILEHDRVFVEKLNYPYQKEIKRGDILVFYPPETELSNSPLKIFARLTGIFCKDIAFIKRTIGLPGDKFEIKYLEDINQYRVFINNEPLNEPYINSKTNWTKCHENMYCGPFIIPKGHYFMMGDNRGNSQDSRFWGFLDENRIIGRANFMFWPISRINLLRDKYLNLHHRKIQSGYENYPFILNRYEFLYKS